jgi:UDP-N-acetylglucosamine acyltransferase
VIDSTAIVHPSARLGAGVSVGPYSIIGPDVVIGDGTVVGPHVVIKGPTTIGQYNNIFQFSSVGEDPQDKKYQGEQTLLTIGDHNTIRESCTINRGTAQGGGITKIGSHNLLMAMVHVAHDCLLGDHNVIANTVNLAGHVIVGSHVTIGGTCAVAQFCRLGDYSFICGFSTVVKDIPPFLLVDGRPVQEKGLNSVGLERQQFSKEDLMALREAYKIFYRDGLSFEEGKAALLPLASRNQRVNDFLYFLNNPSARGIVRK